ncbi:helix-turn-helix domain-containing protein [Pedobacter sp. HMF7647]|uniref:Helix-turn-helix domain-containing protein n=1 Tax=Hufsiella arboris TaxID=2695275 RepID=A0A7K1Y6T4_9SPHI|nr:helix-turn-helix transcriptional regulator [Hufsiella arboris]MXV50284.1 helix-turn-helix domain-containing protein [Hufsiella arboris]
MLFLQSAPHPALRKYIEQYLYHSFHTSILPSLEQRFLPYDRPAVSFFLGPVQLQHDREHLSGPISAKGQSAFAYYNALTTSANTFHFKGNEQVQVIIIQFKPVGFSALFRRDMAELTNQLPDFSLITGASEGFMFLERLVEAKDFAAQVSVLNDFFLVRLCSERYDYGQIREACRKLIVTDGLINMKDLAWHTNMSLRTLERKFTEQVGVTPKVYARIKRLHHALALMNHADPWALKEIVYHCGYYDPAHFNKEFQTFSLQSPSTFCAPEYQLYNQVILNSNLAAF